MPPKDLPVLLLPEEIRQEELEIAKQELENLQKPSTTTLAQPSTNWTTNPRDSNQAYSAVIDVHHGSRQ